MFLELLNTEKKIMFLHLAANAANVNGVLDEAEKQLLEMYAKQMDVEVIEKSDIPLEVVLERLNNICDFNEKKVILFELIGVLFADKEYDDSERRFLESIAYKFGISNEMIDTMVSLMKEYIDLYNRTFENILN